MINKKSAPSSKRRRISFTANFPNADRVVLMGEFNDWSPKKHPMSLSDEGIWQKIVFLYPGTYEYKFIVDGEWKNDPENSLTCPNCYGTRNNFILVEAT